MIIAEIGMKAVITAAFYKASIVVINTANLTNWFVVRGVKGAEG